MLVRVPALLMIVFLTGCNVLHPGIPGSGISQSDIRQVESFEEVNLSGFGKVNVFAGETPSVCVTTDSNLLAHVETNVEDGKLKIKPRGRIRPKTGLRVDVTVPRLTAARISGAGDMNIIDLAGDHLDLSISGAGTLQANGYVNDLSTSISGAGDADLGNLRAANANVRISGSGDACVCASESITARISGAGDLVCYGNPTYVDQSVSGAGDFEIRPSRIEYSFGDNSGYSSSHDRYQEVVE